KGQPSCMGKGQADDTACPLWFLVKIDFLTLYRLDFSGKRFGIDAACCNHVIHGKIDYFHMRFLI
ncbi:MAG: hypothetical protein LIO70_01040, partial [Clostridiales bacterium]|nr:hypothetical protein [Clostridiales bacterium]